MPLGLLCGSTVLFGGSVDEGGSGGDYNPATTSLSLHPGKGENHIHTCDSDNGASVTNLCADISSISLCFSIITSKYVASRAVLAKAFVCLYRALRNVLSCKESTFFSFVNAFCLRIICLRCIFNQV